MAVTEQVAAPCGGCGKPLPDEVVQEALDGLRDRLRATTTLSPAKWERHARRWLPTVTEVRAELTGAPR